MRSPAGALARALLIVLLALAVPARAEEISHYFSSAGAPSLGIHYHELLKTHINMDADLTTGYDLLAELRFQEAIPILKKRAERGGGDDALLSEVYTYLGYGYLNLRQSAQAVDALTSAVKLNPRNDTAYLFLALEYFMEGNKSRQRECLERAVALRPTAITAIRMLAEFYKEHGEPQKAARYYEKIVEILPNSGYFRFQLYKVYEALGNYAGAEANLMEMKKLEPEYFQNYARLGDVYLKQNKMKEAFDAYSSLVEKAPDFYLGYLGKAKVHILKGDLLAARAEVDKARSLSPGNKEVRDAVREIDDRIDQGKMLAIKRMLAVTGVLILLVLLVYFYFDMHRKKYVISILTRFNQQLDKTYEQDELAGYVLDFFTRVLSASTGILLHYNRQNNELLMGTASGVITNSLIGFKIICGGEVANWVLREKKPVLEVDALDKSESFEGAFPSFAPRLKEANLDFLLPLKEKNFFWGFLAVGFPKERKPVHFREHDLLVPLITSATQALETLYLYESSMNDETTGLFNKRYFRQTLGVELKRADRYQQPCSLITFDLDDFKKINDTYGHSQGDQVLKGIGQLVRGNIREGIDTGARTGGEEFFIILPATSTDRAVMVAERLRTSVEEYPFALEGSSKPLRVTVSVGVATYPVHAMHENELVERTDEAQYLAKKSGKNRVCVVEQLAKADAKKHMKKGMAFESRFDNLNIRDDATRLFNFTYFSMRLKEELKRVDRYRLPCSVLLFSVENPPPGDVKAEVLRIIGTTLKESLREGIDTPARMEGERFIVLVPETEGERCVTLAERVKRQLESKEFPPTDYRMEVAMAISCYPVSAGGEGQLLETLDWALKKARSEGGKVTLAPPAAPG